MTNDVHTDAQASLALSCCMGLEVVIKLNTLNILPLVTNSSIKVGVCAIAISIYANAFCISSR